MLILVILTWVIRKIWISFISFPYHKKFFFCKVTFMSTYIFYNVHMVLKEIFVNFWKKIQSSGRVCGQRRTIRRPCLFELPSSSLPKMDIHLASVTPSESWARNQQQSLAQIYTLRLSIVSLLDLSSTVMFIHFQSLYWKSSSHFSHT